MPKIVATNKKARFEYQITDDLEAGIALDGLEIKAIRDSRVNITGSYVRPFVSEKGTTELWWVGGSFGDEKSGNSRSKKLLLHKSEIEKIAGKLTSKGYTVIPLELYLSRGIAKLKIGLGLAKQKQDRREELKKRDIDRDINRRLRSR